MEIKLGNIPDSQETLDKDVLIARERRKTAEAVGWTVFFCVLVMAITLANTPTWPVAVGVVGIAIAITIVCSIILLKQK